MFRLFLLHTLCAVVALFVLLAARDGRAEVYGHATQDGRYAVVATEMYFSGEPAPDSRRQTMVVLIDTWTGRAWMLSQDRVWQALPYAIGRTGISPPSLLPPRLEE